MNEILLGFFIGFFSALLIVKIINDPCKLGLLHDYDWQPTIE